MHFKKFPLPANFEFLRHRASGGEFPIGSSFVRIRMDRFEGDIHRLAVRSPLWGRNRSQAGLTPPRKAANGGTRLTIGRGFGLTLRDAKNRVVLSSPPGAAFGLCGTAFMFQFHRETGDQFYGMGEKLFGLELSGRRTRFWNTDAIGDFASEECREGRYDPAYVSIPYLILKRGNVYTGLLLDNPFASFIFTDSRLPGGPHRPPRETVCIGAPNGPADLYLLHGPSLAELTRKLQKLVGCTPLPPAWALGYHQCRWGYRSARDLEALDRKFRGHRIPCDGLWLDIDYMDGYRVFTFNRKNFPNPRGTFASLAKRGRRVVPIIDPGVKFDPGYAVYESGRKVDVFCRNPQGRPYVGIVWPGETVFPDFPRPEARRWWAQWVKGFAETGVAGAWLDMNDPSVGRVDLEEMRFNRGRDPHDAYHNQYALGMQMASREGFLAARPRQRPFLISRSGCLGTSRYAGIWTGDNFSNYRHLQLSIPCTLNLALSGVPFNAPDIGGFAGDTNPRLIREWMKTCFLFPFARNHSCLETRPQEPWAFGPQTLRALRHYIALRYKLRPYLYNLFVLQEEIGEAILRPLFYDFEDTPALPLGKIEDQFMVGPSVMQAPLVTEKDDARRVVLPGRAAWWSAMDARWIRGGHTIRVRPGPMQTPLYMREGALLPLARTREGDSAFDPLHIECHVFLRRSTTAGARLVYVADDGETFEYRQGKRTRIGIAAQVERGELLLSTTHLQSGYGPVDVRFILYDRFARVRVDGKRARLKPHRWLLAGTPQPAWAVLPERA